MKEVVLAINYKPELMANYLRKYESEVPQSSAVFACKLFDCVSLSLSLSPAQLGIKITYSQETQPMGTGKHHAPSVGVSCKLTLCARGLDPAGPLALAREVLEEDGEPFFVLNSDITCEYPLADLLAFHKDHGKEGTIMVTKVEEPSKYGVVVLKEGGQIDKFVEKPKIYVGNKINAGIYIFNASILNRIEVRPHPGFLILPTIF